MEPNTERAAKLPGVSLATTALSSLVWLMLLSGPTFPMSIFFMLLGAASLFAVGTFGCLLHVRRRRSAAHRVAYFASIAFFSILAASWWAGNINAHRSLALNDLVGIYLPDSSTRADLGQRLHLLTPNHKIELRSDGTFTMTDIPDFWQFTNTPTHLIGATGKWSARGRSVAIEYTGEASTPMSSNPEGHFSASFEVLDFFPPYRLRCYLGDPDSGYASTYAKSK